MRCQLFLQVDFESVRHSSVSTILAGLHECPSAVRSGFLLLLLFLLLAQALGKGSISSVLRTFEERLAVHVPLALRSGLQPGRGVALTNPTWF
jgi:hypothetical protein